MGTRVFQINDETYIGFFSFRSPFSNFFKSEFVCPDELGSQQHYRSSEQLYFHSKAIFYNEFQLARQIMVEDRPSSIKQIGKRIVEDERWEEKGSDVMERALYHKFTQNARLLQLLLCTFDAELVEASPTDSTWGIGIGLNDHRLTTKSEWNGRNKLGKIMMVVRTRIMEDPRYAKNVEDALFARERKSIEEIIHDFLRRSSIRVDSLIGSSPSSHATVPILPAVLKSEAPQPSPEATVLSPDSNVIDPTVPASENDVSILSGQSKLSIQNIRLTHKKERLQLFYTKGPCLTVGKFLYLSVISELNGSCLLDMIYSEFDSSLHIEDKPRLKKALSRRVNSLNQEEKNLTRRGGMAEMSEFYSRTLNPSFININHMDPVVLISPVSSPAELHSSPSKKVASCPEQLLSYSPIDMDPDILSMPPPRKIKKVRSLIEVAPSRSAFMKRNPDILPPKSDPVRRPPLSNTLSPKSSYSPLPRPHIPSFILPRSHSSPLHSPSKARSRSRIPRSPSPHSLSTSHRSQSPIQLSFHMSSPISSPLKSPLLQSPLRKKLKTAHTVMLPSGRSIRARMETSGEYDSDDGDTMGFALSGSISNSAPCSSHSLSNTQSQSNLAHQWKGAKSGGNHASLPKNVKQNLGRTAVRKELYKKESSSLRKENKLLIRDQFRLETITSEKDKTIVEQAEALSKMTTELRASRKVAAEQEAQIDDLKNQLHAKESSEKDLKRGRHYTPETHVTVLKLKEIGIADVNIGKAMQIVSGELFQTKLKSTPSATTVGRMSYEMNALANKNTAMKLSKLVKDKKCMSIGSDETTKLYHKLQAYQIWYEDDNGKRKVHNLAMKPVISKSAEVSLNTVLQILDRIDKSSSEQSSETSHLFRDLVIAQTHSAIGDRATTQTRFAELFEQYRVEILPKVMEEWASMSDDERTAHQTFLSLPCQLHVIASAISPAMIALAKHEEEITGATGLKEETSSVNLALKLFTHTFGSRSSAKYGTFRIFRAWCKKKKIPCISLPALNGNRFNIIPTIAARIFLNRATYAEFLSEVNIESKKSLLEALSNEIVMKHIQSLGFIDQYVTGPLWRILNSDDINTLDAHKYITAFDEWMVQRVSNPSQIFTVASPKIGLPIPEKTFKFSGTIMKELLSVPTCPMLERAVSLTMSAIREFIAKVLAPFTTGGLIHSISTTNTVMNNAMKGMIGAAPLTNMGCESVFGYADYLINKAPRKRISRVEGELLCKRNNVLEWLDSMGAVERDQIIRECIKESRLLEREAREECEQLNNAILEIETKKAELNEARKIRVCALDKELTNYLMSYGFFQSKEDIDTFLQNESDIQNQVTVLVKQLRYRQKILKQEPKGKKFFTVTEGKKSLTVAQLRCKLVNAIECDPELNQTQIGDVSISTIRNKSFVQHGKDDSFTFNVTDCRKAWHRGPSYLLLKYDHRPFTTAMTYDYFSDLLDKKIFESV